MTHSKDGGPRLNENERRVLGFLRGIYDHDANCAYFGTIVVGLDIEWKQVRRACRSLARKGLAEYHRGLFNMDGEVAGSGYCCTPEGKTVLDALLARSEQGEE